MKTYIKSLLAIATVALLGSSAWAADYDVGQIHVDEETQTYSASYIKEGAKQKRWFCLYCTSGDKSYVTPTFLDPQPDKDGLLSHGATEEAFFKFTGAAEGKATWTVYRTSASGDKIPDCSNPPKTNPYSGDTKNSWQAQDTYTIEVVGGHVVIAEEVAVGEGKTEELTVTSEESGSWVATVTDGDDVVSLKNAAGSGTSLTFGVTGLKAGTAKVSVSQNGDVKALYNVTVFGGSKVLTLCIGDAVELNYNNPNAERLWMLDETKGGAVLASKAGQGTSRGAGQNMTFTSYKVTLTAVEEGTKGIWVRNKTTSSEASWTEVDAFMVKVVPVRESQVLEQEVSVDCRGTTASAGVATWTYSVDPANAASVTFENASVSGATAKVTGHEDGDAVVIAGNTSGTLSDGMSGIAYTLAFNFAEKIDVIEPVFVKATRTTLTGGAASEIQYDGFLTTKGAKYAWGDDGKPLTDWIVSDGTPCDLAKPAEATQLLTIKAK